MALPPAKIPKSLQNVSRVFAHAGRQCWLVGGAIRDGLLGLPTDDYDLATDAKPEEVQRLFHRTIPTGIRHGTLTILIGGREYETTTFRRDGKYSDGRRPDDVVYADTITEDLSRRDFTINAIAWDLVGGVLLDPHDGRGDLRRRVIRAIGDPTERLEEDGLRSIRACRFASQLGFDVDRPTLDAIGRTLHKVPGLSAERIYVEFKKILSADAPSRAFRLFRATGLLPLLFPELDAAIAVIQGGRHRYDVYDHSLRACDAAPRDNFSVRAAALLHDVGKPPTAETGKDGVVTFHRHEIVGAEMVEALMIRFKASNAERERVTRLVRHHMFHYTDDWTDAAVRRFIARCGVDLIDDLFALRLADARAMRQGGSPSTENLEALRDRLDAVLESEAALTIRNLAINGNDLMESLELPRGPVIGRLLNYLLDCVLEDPDVNNRVRLIDLARRWMDVYG